VMKHNTGYTMFYNGDIVRCACGTECKGYSDGRKNYYHCDKCGESGEYAVKTQHRYDINTD